MAIITYGQAYMHCVERVWSEKMKNRDFWKIANGYNYFMEQLDNDYDYFTFKDIIADYDLDINLIWAYMNEFGFTEKSHWTDTETI